jgi:integrase
VFTSGIGTPLEPRNLFRAFKALLCKASLPDIRFHDLRHSAASLLLAQGVPMRAVMELLGHSSISTTADIYSHVMPAMMRDVAEKIDAILACR